MDSTRKTAVIVGILFIFATAFSLISTSFTGPILGAANLLASVSANENTLIVGALFLLASALSIALIPTAIYPVLKQHSQKIALGYFGIRIIEAVTLFVDTVCLLLLVTLARQYVATQVAGSYFATIGAVLLGGHNWMFLLDPIIFGLSALMFYYLLYRAKLLPSWLSAWGLVGGALVFAGGLLGMFGSFLTVLIVLALPIAVQEMAMAVWLIIKGFNPSAVKVESVMK